MKEITIIEPVFVAEFQCAGSTCRDHCCKGWDIFLDKASVNRYLKSPQIEIRNIASQHIATPKKSFQHWGKMKLTSSGNCAFLDEESLCKVHKNMGGAALSQTCSTYPRSQNMSRYEVNKSLSLSCPEATKRLLSRPDAMMLHQSVQIQPNANNSADVDNLQKLVNLMCVNIVKIAGSRASEGIYGIAMLLLHLEKLNKEPEFNSEALENYYFTIINAIEEGSIARSIDDLTPNYDLQWALLLRMQPYFSGLMNVRSATTLNHYLNKLIHIQVEGAKENDVSSSIIRLDTAWNDKVVPWLAERPHVISNYLQYRIYSDNFPGYQNRSPLACLYLLTAEWFMIKSLIAANAELVGKIDEDDVVNIIYSFHALTKHTEHALAAFFAEIDKVKVNDDLSLIYLLK